MRSLRATVPAATIALAFSAAAPNSSVVVVGSITDESGAPLAAALVTARMTDRNTGVTVISDERGLYRFPELEPAGHRLEAKRIGYSAQTRELDLGRASEARLEIDFMLSPSPHFHETAPASAFLNRLPDGDFKRQFKLDCTGCHQFSLRTISKDGHPKSLEEWVARIDQMLGFAGAASSFPIMSAGREAGTTAAWLVAHLGDADDPLPQLEPPAPMDWEAFDAVITEYDLPNPDLPHDVMVAPGGRVLVTGMFTHRMYILDPESGHFAVRPIPVENANPRALDIDREGNWWVLLGAPMRLASFKPATKQWRTYELGMYPHSVVLDAEGSVWFNGHFTKDPELIGVLDTRSGEVMTYGVPALEMPGGASTIPYGMRVGPDGTLWGTELAGNRLISFDPRTQEFGVYVMPTTHSGPRRLDVAPDGTVWIPEYAGNRLARFDTKTAEFKEYEFPIPDALPYVVRVDPRRGTVWVGTAGADAIARFDPASERFAVYRLPTRGALIRHIDIDVETGDVWGAYSPAPVISPRVFRLRR